MKLERQGHGRAIEADFRERPHYYASDDSPPHRPARAVMTGTAFGLAVWLIVTLAAFVVYAVY